LHSSTQGDPVIAHAMAKESIARYRTVKAFAATGACWIGTIPTRPLQGSNLATAFTHDGNELLVLTAEHKLELWDIASLSLRHPPVAAPTPDRIIGITKDGHVVTNTTESLLGERIDFWDLQRGTGAGSLNVEQADAPDDSARPDSDLATLQAVSSDVLPTPLPVTAAEWADQLCLSVGGKFTAAEVRAVIPSLAAVEAC
jgi:hypothetical protein